MEIPWSWKLQNLNIRLIRWTFIICSKENLIEELYLVSNVFKIINRYPQRIIAKCFVQVKGNPTQCSTGESKLNSGTDAHVAIICFKRWKDPKTAEMSTIREHKPQHFLQWNQIISLLCKFPNSEGCIHIHIYIHIHKLATSQSYTTTRTGIQCTYTPLL